MRADLRNRQLLADEIRAGADVAKLAAESYERLSETKDAEGNERKAFSKVLVAANASRPLMPRSVRGGTKPTPASNDKEAPSLSRCDDHSGSDSEDEQIGVSREKRKAQASIPPRATAKHPRTTGMAGGSAPRERGVGENGECPAEVNGQLATDEGNMNTSAINARTQDCRNGHADVEADKQPRRCNALVEQGKQGNRQHRRPDGTSGGGRDECLKVTAEAGASTPVFLAGCSVSFEREDFTVDPHSDRGYDVVSLFSLVKWIHINGGDETLRRVFRKAHALLRPGGRLILEPQVGMSHENDTIAIVSSWCRHVENNMCDENHC